ncbi:MAG: hypothetical protein ABI584_13630 [Acidobacteriota bacterium]
MSRLRFVAYAFVVPFAAALLAASPARAEGGKQKFERRFPFVGDKDIKVGLKVGDATIESFRIRHWPDADDFRKAEKDLNEKHTMVVEFRYSNRDRDNDYKCKYVVTIPGGRDGRPFGENDRTATLDKGKIDDTNSFFVKMVTNDYKVAKTIRISFEIWKK